MIFALIALSFVLTMLANCVLAWTLQTLWGWFCVESLGAGPSMGAWFGISCIVCIMFMANMQNVTRTETKKADTWARPVSIVLSCLLTLAIAWIFGTILGWRA